MQRTLEQLKEHYQIEKELANKLKNSSKEERKEMYTAVYDEMLKKVPHHPLLTRKKSTEETEKSVAAQMEFLQRFKGDDAVFAEIGAGDCTLTFEMSKKVKKTYAIDVSNEISNQKNKPANFELIISDGTSIPLPPESVSLIYSNQLMEHIHPDDAVEQLGNILNVLTKGGKYVCITPNRINGPHDISRYFDNSATGFHLVEYTFTSLKELFKKTGFSKVHGYFGAKGIFVRVPFILITLTEKIISALPASIRRKRIFDPFLNIRVAGVK